MRIFIGFRGHYAHDNYVDDSAVYFVRAERAAKRRLQRIRWANEQNRAKF